ncbi:ATP-binding protein [Edaphobacillus lindanitolerans]|uniref:MoxR-like ATPase n=1 Tax=Edaphobacillus lindanitolerans TaxID=550447 RepID=A0A1U7PM10_9BACI|nr:MoxR family ATPase [Edaphobacillus lindanitolerans]SIT80775.1 MoxR-like ATPase [Edaphobacillus lindanitolerans]
MEAIIGEERKERLSRRYGEEDSVLIGTGGYVSPDPHLWEDVLTAVVIRRPVLLKGPTGSGKTKLAESVSGFFSQPMHQVNCSVDLDAEALLGYKTIIQKEGRTEIDFVDGPVIHAMKNGHILYIDEINMAKPETLPILHSVLDHRRMLTNPFTGEVISAHPDFNVIAAINEGYVGTVPMNEALKNRFIAFHVPYLGMQETRELLESEFPDAPSVLIATMLDISEDLREQVRNGLLEDEAASIRSLIDATELALHIGPERAVRYAVAEKMEDRGERQLVMDLVRTRIR